MILKRKKDKETAPEAEEQAPVKTEAEKKAEKAEAKADKSKARADKSRAKPKLNFGEGDGHNFFAKHVEKLVLVVVALLVGYFVYSGMSLEGLEDNKSPKALRQDADTARANLELTEWEMVKDEDPRDVGDLTRRLASRGGGLLEPTDPMGYQQVAILEPPIFLQKSKRVDPQLYPPEELEVEPGYGPVAMNGSLALDPLMEAARAAKAAEEAVAKKARPKRRAADAYGMDPMGAGLDPSEIAGMGGEMGAYGATTPTGPQATPEQLAAVPGFRPGSGGSTGYYGDPAGGGYGAEAGVAAGATGTVAKGRFFMAIKALVPYRKQWGEFETTFQDAYDYNPGRDIPQYYWYQVDRVEVDDQGQVVETMKDPWNPRTAQWYGQNWYAGSPQEIVDPPYFDKLLTTPAPPLMMRELEQYQLHSKTPKRQLVAPTTRLPTRRVGDDAVPPTGGLGEGLGPQGRSPYGMGGEGVGYAAGMSADPAGGANPYGADPYGAGGGAYGYGEGASSYRAGGYSAEGGYGATGPIMAPTVDYKLFRFYDFMVQPGKKYKYRVKLFLIDPNHPVDPSLTPANPFLADDVISRIKQIDEADAQKSQSTGQPSRTFWRETEWSDWSDVVSIPPRYEVLAGAVTPERKTPNRELKIEIPEPGSEPEGKVLAMVWDHEKAADIPGLQNVYRGSVLNFQTDPAVMHPVSLQVVKLKDYPIRTNCMVLDVRGGQPLPTTDRTIDHKAPGEMLIRDAAGNLMVRNELDDLGDFRNNYFTEPEKPKAPPVDPAMSEYSSDPAMMGEGGGRRGRRNRGEMP